MRPYSPGPSGDKPHLEFHAAAVGDEGVSDDEEAVWRGISMTS
jgi:hypothetical protein